MSLNRVIGANNRLPWHLPEEFKWFKEKTMGQVLVMGRKTFESIGKVLPGRTVLVLTRQPGLVAGAHGVLRSLDEIDSRKEPFAGREIFICGGAEVYAQALPFCSDLFLTVVKKTVEGDAFFPPYENLFELERELRNTPEFRILHFRRATFVEPKA